jgi:hypothetical protein
MVFVALNCQSVLRCACRPRARAQGERMTSRRGPVDVCTRCMSWLLLWRWLEIRKRHVVALRRGQPRPPAMSITWCSPLSCAWGTPSTCHWRIPSTRAPVGTFPAGMPLESDSLKTPAPGSSPYDQAGRSSAPSGVLQSSGGARGAPPRRPDHHGRVRPVSTIFWPDGW